MGSRLVSLARALAGQNGSVFTGNDTVESYLTGDLETGKSVLRDYVNATIGFQALEEQTGIPVKNLMRMLGPKGSPSAANLSSILSVLQKTEGVHFELLLRR
jgi:DNA-binding phage protein